MGKNSGGGGNTKVIAANAKKAVAQAEKDAVKARAQEKDASAAWAVGSNQRGSSKAAAAADKQAEKMRRDAEKKALEAEEDAAASSMAKPKKKKKDKDDVSALLMAGLGGTKKKKKVSAPDAKAAEKERQSALCLAQEEAMRKKGVVLADDRDLLRQNRNRMDVADGGATGLDNALDLLSVDGGVEKSKNLKVLFNEFSERETPKVRKENPGLKLSQVKERVFRAWGKSPDNPKNQM